jgi:hypothetical protein
METTPHVTEQATTTDYGRARDTAGYSGYIRILLLTPQRGGLRMLLLTPHHGGLRMLLLTPHRGGLRMLLHAEDYGGYSSRLNVANLHATTTEEAGSR